MFAFLAKCSWISCAPTPRTPEPSLKIDFGSFYIPKKNPVRPRGEDAHFICQNENVFGVADGVGAWALSGVDAGEYSRTLMANCATEAKKSMDPKTVLTAAYLKTNIIGSSTACVLSLRGNVLHAANVGDSGFMVFRENKLVYVSETQQHDFNCPFQLQTGCRYGLPETPWKGSFKVSDGDIVVAGTDGLLDNVHASEIERFLTISTAEGGVDVEPGNLARWLAKLALRYSMDKSRTRTTPFSIAARKQGFLWHGGKIDDITVIVGHVGLQ